MQEQQGTLTDLRNVSLKIVLTFEQFTDAISDLFNIRQEDLTSSCTLRCTFLGEVYSH